ncbi:MAG TPA: hypothetical protein VGG34_13065 [Opitutaceae bacterium]|jgi:hypothetical protein
MLAVQPQGRRDGAFRSAWLVHLAGIAAACIAEVALFRWAAGHHYAWVYPRWYDQLQYLREAYGAEGQLRSAGALAAVRSALESTSPQGNLHAVLALAAFRAFGVSRLSALTVNVVAFAALQVATFFTARRISGSWALGWAAAGLLGAVQFPWLDVPGSASDFRLDWLSACAYGVALAAAVRGNGFRSTPSAILFGLAVGFTLLVRHLTVVYFAMIFLVLLGWLLARPDRWRRSARLVLSGACAAAIGGWSFWKSRKAIYVYYWVNHYVGAERTLRDSHMGPAASAFWEAREIAIYLFGLPALLVGLTAGTWILASSRRRGGIFLPEPDSIGARSSWPAAAAFLLAPLAVFLEHPEKAAQPLCIVIAPLAWMFLLSWIEAARGARRGAVSRSCALAALSGFGLLAYDISRDRLTPAQLQDYKAINAVSDFIYFRSEEAGLESPMVAVTRNYGAFEAGALTISGEERHAHRIVFKATLPTGLVEDDVGLIDRNLRASDFVCLISRGADRWPADHQLAAMLPEMSQWCDADMVLDGTVKLEDWDMRIFERRGLAAPLGQGYRLDSLVAEADRAAGNAPARPPGPPIILEKGQLYWPAAAPFDYVVRVAHSPVAFEAMGLPPGIAMGPNGVFRGRFTAPGKYSIVIHAANAEGSANGAIHVEAATEGWDAQIEAPGSVEPDGSATVGFRACDARGTLDFIDVTDLSVPRVLARLVAGEGERKSWVGRFRAPISGRGTHKVVFRFVRYDSVSGYTFIDRMFKVAAAQ